MAGPVFTTKGAKLRKIFEQDTLDPDEKNMVRVMVTFDKVLVRIHEMADDRSALRIDEDLAYHILIKFAKCFDHRKGLFTLSDLTIVEEFEALGDTLRGDVEANSLAFLDTVTLVLKLISPFQDRTSVETAVAALAAELASLLPPDEDEDGYDELHQIYLARRAHLQSAKRKVREMAPFLLVTASFVHARMKGGLSKAGTATTLKNFTTGETDSPEAFLREMREAINKSNRWPEAFTNIDLLDLGSATKDAIISRGFIAVGSINDDMENIVAGSGTTATYLHALGKWASVADNVHKSSAATSALYARGERGDPCTYCQRLNHGVDRCWKKMQDEGKELPPEATQYRRPQPAARVNFSDDVVAKDNISKVDSELIGRRKLQFILVRPQADQCATAFKDVLDSLMPGSANTTWTEAKRQILIKRVRELVYDVAAM
ncbi:hypothetical protein T484DRAFT_3632162 [Baffinella frigidus]|nr:hypothetical protein T484DRAFT_3632162 [Cryptophyta sp. CCMP2293]